MGPISYKKVSSLLGVKELSSKYKNVMFESFKGFNNSTENDLTFLYDDYNYSTLQTKFKGVIISDKRKDLSNFKHVIHFYYTCS